MSVQTTKLKTRQAKRKRNKARVKALPQVTYNGQLKKKRWSYN